MPRKRKGPDGHHTVEALKPMHQPRQRSVSEDISVPTEPVNTGSILDADIVDSLIDREARQ